MGDFSELIHFTPDRGKSYKERQNCFIPDHGVKKVVSSKLVENNKFRKRVFTDGSSTVSPKAYIPSDFSIKNNGAKKQGLNTVFKPKPGTENAGFILNTNHINWPNSSG